MILHASVKLLQLLNAFNRSQESGRIDKNIWAVSQIEKELAIILSRSLER